MGCHGCLCRSRSDISIPDRCQIASWRQSSVPRQPAASFPSNATASSLCTAAMQMWSVQETSGTGCLGRLAPAACMELRRGIHFHCSSHICPAQWASTDLRETFAWVRGTSPSPAPSPFPSSPAPSHPAASTRPAPSPSSTQPSHYSRCPITEASALILSFPLWWGKEHTQGSSP